MESDLHVRADQALRTALERTGARDPREFYRELLRELKRKDEDAYRGAVDRWRQEVIEPLARGDGDPLERWLRYGLELARAVEPGRTVIVNDTGRAEPLSSAPSWTDLVLQLPERRKVRAIPVSIPPSPTGPQRATLDLLVQGRVSLPEP
jgi:hypothetical protein